MYLSQIEITRGVSGESIELAVGEPQEGYLLRSARGLGPTKAEMSSTDRAVYAGAVLGQTRRGVRNIVLDIELIPDYVDLSPADLRAAFYKVVFPEVKVKLTFTLNDRWETPPIDAPLELEIMGTVEAVETELFSKETSLQVSIMCYDPDFVDPVEKTVTGNTDDSSSFGYEIMEYKGTVPNGLIWICEFSEDYDPADESGELTLTSRRYAFGDPVYERMKIASADIGGSRTWLRMSTRQPGKYIVKAWTETTTSIALMDDIYEGVLPSSSWPMLYPGRNDLQLYTPGYSEDDLWTVYYYEKYGSVS